jgi:hypothetical protein
VRGSSSLSLRITVPPSFSTEIPSRVAVVFVASSFLVRGQRRDKCLLVSRQQPKDLTEANQLQVKTNTVATRFALRFSVRQIGQPYALLGHFQSSRCVGRLLRQLTRPYTLVIEQEPPKFAPMQLIKCGSGRRLAKRVLFHQRKRNRWWYRISITATCKINTVRVTTQRH